MSRSLGGGGRRAFVSVFIQLAMIMLVATLFDGTEAKKKKAKGANMQGSPFGQSKVQMVFITLRDDFVQDSQEECSKMAKNFQAMMATGGLHVGIVGTEKNQMVAVANTIRELIEIRKFATNLEEVLSIEYDKSKFVGNYVTDEERVKHNLPAKETKDDDDAHSDEL